ncbi:hypothetical protein PATSB16_14630 [Pandoraea thiooxydans]|nr:hypothetical protein PATSB16_14630 [Pandoraea thiooxydans]
MNELTEIISLLVDCNALLEQQNINRLNQSMAIFRVLARRGFYVL